MSDYDEVGCQNYARPGHQFCDWHEHGGGGRRMDEQAKKDLLIIVPDHHFQLYKRVIRHTLWAARSEVTADILSGDMFAEIYGDEPICEMARKLKERSVEVGAIDLSKREQTAYDKIIKAVRDYLQQQEKTP